MAKFLIPVLIAVLVCQGYSVEYGGDVAKAAAAGDWDSVQKILKSSVGSTVFSPQTQQQQFGSLQLPSFSGDVSSNGSGGRFFSQSEYSYQQKMTDKDGVVSEDKGGLGMINDNGRISYYKPQQNQKAAIVPPHLI